VFAQQKGLTAYQEANQAAVPHGQSPDRSKLSALLRSIVLVSARHEHPEPSAQPIPRRSPRPTRRKMDCDDKTMMLPICSVGL
jgi:hypothetical protein